MLLPKNILPLFLIASMSLGAKPAPKGKTPPPPLPEPIVVMAYNVENLFDAEHDEGKDDWTYLPAAQKKNDNQKKQCESLGGSKFQQKECLEFDWSETEVKAKLERIGKIVGSANGGKCPDILFLEEVENLKVLERLRSEFLKSCNYKPGILLEGDDRRGIDPAILSRFDRSGEPRLHTIDFVETRKSGESPRTRGLLEATFKLPSGDQLTAIGIHFPAPYHPFIQRQDAMQALARVAQKAAEQSQIVIAAGDFNTTSKEDSQLYRRVAGKDWLISHLEGCRQCLGTHYFKRDESWSFLDAIMQWRGGKTGAFEWTMDGASVKVIQGFDFQTTAEGIPLAWEGSQKPGQSDHLPLLLEIRAARATGK